MLNSHPKVNSNFFDKKIQGRILITIIARVRFSIITKKMNAMTKTVNAIENIKNVVAKMVHVIVKL